MVEAKHRRTWVGEVVCGVGEAAVGRAVCEHGIRGGEAVDLDAHEGEGSPTGKSPGNTADRNNDGCHLQRPYKRGQTHRACEDEMTRLPGGHEVGFVVVDDF